MENVSLALKMAAGLLIGVLLTSLVVYMYSNIRDLEVQREKTEHIRQITEFNQRFTAYEKSSMYGTDIMSVMGLAYNNNLSANAGIVKNPIGNYDPDVEGSVNIILVLKTEIIGKTIENDYLLKDGVEKLIDSRVKDTKKVFDRGTYSLQIKNNNDNTVLEKIKKIVIDGNKEVNVNYGGYEYDAKLGGKVRTDTITSITGFSDFKTRIFKNVPEDTKYDAEGRIKEMKFEEIKEIE